MTERKMFVPRDYQHIALDHILERRRNALFASMGMGKSVVCLTALDTLQLIDPRPVLILAPKRVAATTWPDEALKWSHLSDVTVAPILGTKAERIKALNTPATAHTMNYENIPWLIEHLNGKWPFKTVIADESTRLKSYRSRGGSKRARALSKVAHKHVENFIELTGTPSPNGLIDLWGQLYFLDGGERLGRTFGAFTDRWFKKTQVGAQRFAVRLDAHEHSQKEIQDAIRDICLTLDAYDYFDIAKPIINNIYVDLPSQARNLYEQMEKEMFFELDGSEIEAMNAAAKTIKCLQLANGAVYDAAGEWKQVHDVKLQALESIIEEAGGMPVLVAYHFKSDLQRLKKAFKQGRELDSDPQTIRDWNAGKIPVMFAHPASAGHGLNLQDGGNILAVFGHWWNLEEYQQIVERIGSTRQAQAGHDRPVFIYHILARDTVDDLIMDRRESKKNVQDILLEAMKRKENKLKLT